MSLKELVGKMEEDIYAGRIVEGSVEYLGARDIGCGVTLSFFFNFPYGGAKDVTRYDSPNDTDCVADRENPIKCAKSLLEYYVNNPNISVVIKSSKKPKANLSLFYDYHSEESVKLGDGSAPLDFR